LSQTITRAWAPGTSARPDRSAALLWTGLGYVALILLPFNATPGGFFSLGWVHALGTANGSAAAQAIAHEKLWLAPLALALLLTLGGGLAATPHRRAACLLLGSLAGFAWLAVIAGSIDLHGWTWGLPSWIFGPLPHRNPGFGAGAWVYGLAALMLLCCGLAARGAFSGEEFTACAAGLLAGVLALFVAYPLLRVGASALQTARGAFAPELFLRRLTENGVWGARGVVINSVLLGICSAAASTVLALAFALLTERTRMPGRRLLRAISILPIITPPFVIGLAVILLFGRNGALNHLLEAGFGIEPTRWIYGFKGLLFAQVLSFTPMAYLVMIGVVQGLNPSMEEAAQTLRADPARLFFTITLPLVMPGLANAFLVCFIESLADFGNPLILGGDFDVLATSIYFAVVGARADRGFAAVLSLILLTAVLAIFLIQRALVSRRGFTTIGGKGQSGSLASLPRWIKVLAGVLALPWAALTLVLYGTVMVGGFVENLGLNATFTLRHYAGAFGIDWADTGLRFTGQAWDPLFTTLALAAIAAPLTGILGIVTAHILQRRRFRGRSAFEFATLLAAAVPGTVLGIGYILAFNNPPLDLVGTSAIVVSSFVTRNMGVGVRAAIAGFSQIDRSLEEASAMLRAGSFRTFTQIVLPLLRPAIVAALVYGFVAAMTTVSAVIFLVSPGVMLATVYIVNLAEAGTYGMAIATATVLIVVMLVIILGIGRVVGERTLRRPAVSTLAGGSPG
jgi:iron(III) transport system permease protein